MTPEAQTLDTFREHYPEIPIKDEAHFFENIKAVSRYIINLFNMEAYSDVRNIMALVGTLHIDASPKVRMGLENIVFYDLGTWFASHGDRRSHCELLPENICAIITRQFISSSI